MKNIELNKIVNPTFDKTLVIPTIKTEDMARVMKAGITDFSF